MSLTSNVGHDRRVGRGSADSSTISGRYSAAPRSSICSRTGAGRSRSSRTAPGYPKLSHRTWPRRPVGSPPAPLSIRAGRIGLGCARNTRRPCATSTTDGCQGRHSTTCSAEFTNIESCSISPHRTVIASQEFPQKNPSDSEGFDDKPSGSDALFQELRSN